MANNNSIYNRIEENGTNEAQQIIAEGKKKAEELEQSILAGYKLEADKIVSDAKKDCEDKLKTTLTQVEQAAKQNALNAKKNALKKVIDGAELELLKMSDDKLSALVIKILKNEKLKGNETLAVNKTDRSKYQNIFSSKKDDNLDLLNAKLGNAYKLTLDKEEADIKGGFIIKSENYDIDHSYKVLLNDIKESNEAELASILFK